MVFSGIVSAILLFLVTDSSSAGLILYRFDQVAPVREDEGAFLPFITNYHTPTIALDYTKIHYN